MYANLCCRQSIKPMPIILKIGYQAYLMKSPSAAASVVAAMASAVKLDHTYNDGGDWWWPSRDMMEIKLEQVPASRLLRADPRAIKVQTKSARILEAGSETKRLGV